VRHSQVKRPDAGQRVFIGTGTPTPQSLRLLDEGLVGGIVAIDFEAMGRQAYWTLKHISRGEHVEPVVRTGVTIHVGPGTARP
jgi:ABC-type sugar transport system substrate-binding protein